MRRLRPILLIALAVAGMLYGAHHVANEDLRYTSRCAHFSSGWFNGKQNGEGPVIVVTGTSTSGLRGQEYGVSNSLERALQQRKAIVYNATGGTQFLADQWGAIMRTASQPVDLYLFEINSFLLNEREELNTPGPTDMIVRDGSNYPQLFLRAGARVSWLLWRQGGFEPLLVEWLRSYLRPYDKALCQQEQRRRNLRDTVVERVKPQTSRLSRAQKKIQIGKNFGRKDYEDGNDSQVLLRFLDWVAARRLPVVVYFPPLNLPFITEYAGDAAGERFARFREKVVARCDELGVRCLDYTDLFSEDRKSFRDYGHLNGQPFYDELVARLLQDIPFMREFARQEYREPAPDKQGRRGDPHTIGCSDGQREGLTDEELFPAVAGCLARWSGISSLRAQGSGRSCGDDAERCLAPSDACASGWHLCGVDGDPEDLRGRLSFSQCKDAGPGRFVAGFSHVSRSFARQAQCGPAQSTAHFPCSTSGWGAAPVCCGADCGLGVCRDAVWPQETRASLGTQEGCAQVTSDRNGGILCCKD